MHPALRKLVEERADRHCEYCRLHHSFQALIPFHVEHIIARQHGGDDSAENLAFACHRCNLYKGPNLTSIDPQTGDLSRLFHPRKDRWTEHFEQQGGRILGKIPVGRTTSSLLQMNSPDRIELRIQLLAAGLWK